MYFQSQVVGKRPTLLKGSASGKTVGFIDHSEMASKLNMRKKRPKLV